MWAFSIVARIAAAVVLLLALMPNPVGYYQVVRLVVSAVCVFGIYCANKWHRHGWIFVFAWLAILFNPVYQVALPDAVWKIVDALVVALMLVSIFILKPTRQATARV